MLIKIIKCLLNIYLMIFQIIILLIILAIIFYFVNKNNSKIYKENYNCDLDNLNIDDLIVVKRTPEYSELIKNIIDEKKFLFTDEQLKVLNNSQQIFNKKNNNINNISNVIYTNCKNNLDSEVNKNYNNDLINYSDKEYNEMINEFKNDINTPIKPNCYNTSILKNKKYLQNYYQDLYGNKVEASLSDYFADYYTNIDNKDNTGLSVNTLPGMSNFLIPEQYFIQNKLTNAYNIDWNRIIHPYSYY